ncbi:protein adenylyltransferase SelO family protein, partial [Clostridium sporogenes]
MKERKVIIETGFNLENSYASLPEIFFTRQSPSRVPSPKLAVLNYPLIASLGLNAPALQSADGIDILAGNKTSEGSIPIAQAYAGHQFGHFTMLGDGRALLIGEHITPLGERFDIQLKGSGKTPYSR